MEKDDSVLQRPDVQRLQRKIQRALTMKQTDRIREGIAANRRRLSHLIGDRAYNQPACRVVIDRTDWPGLWQ